MFWRAVGPRLFVCTFLLIVLHFNIAVLLLHLCGRAAAGLEILLQRENIVLGSADFVFYTDFLFVVMLGKHWRYGIVCLS